MNSHTTLRTALPTLLTLALGCGPGGGASTSELEALADQYDAQAQIDREAASQAAKDQAAAEARARADALASQDGSELTIDDMKRGDKLTRGDILTTSIRAGIRGQQKLNLITVQHALNLFWGLEGRYPRSHEEFMEKVIRANNIVLEPLEEQYEYWYSAEDHELYKRATAEAIAQAEAEAQAAEQAAQQP